MKLTAAQVSGFVRQPPRETAAVLVYGPDEGLVRERADAIAHAVLGGAGDDPFRLALLTGDMVRQDPALLADEAASLSLMGGRRVVRVREAGDPVAKPLDYVLSLKGTDSLIVLESGDLGRASALRKLAEAAPNAAAIACYPDGPREIAQLIRETLRGHGITVAGEALEYLVENLGGDRGLTRQEIEKLSLYAGDGGTVGLAEAIASVGDTSALELEDVVYDALDGKPVAVEAQLTRLFLEGQSPVTVLRAAQRHVQRLHLCGVQIAGGDSPDGAVRGLRPPIFFKYEPRFRAQLNQWPPDRAQTLLTLLTKAELDCKSTGYPDETICRHVLTGASRLPGGRS